MTLEAQPNNDLITDSGPAPAAGLRLTDLLRRASPGQVGGWGDQSRTVPPDHGVPEGSAITKFLFSNISYSKIYF